MAKRSAITLSEDDDDYVHDESEGEDYKPVAKRPRTKTAGKHSKKAETGGPAVAKNPDTDARNDPPHAVSRHVITESHAERINTALMAWYDTVHAARGMPWRKPFDPAWTEVQRGQRAYEVWVSEIMLQQTQVATVIPYYNRWMEKFPTLKDLAAASIDQVHALWKGLGYYSRASRLLEGAKKVMNTPKFHGMLPVTAKAMQADVPGVGRYSAGAICSIAYSERAPVLDGNVNRLLSRVLALHSNPKSKQTLDLLWDAATVLVEHPIVTRPGDLNQALIELGSTVCKPKDPSCTTCPIRVSCGAFNLQQAALDPLARGTSAQVTSAAGATSKRSAPPPHSGPQHEIPDIEELCGLCEPFPDDSPSSVTVYPMKAEKKKAREETDLVQVVEWRSTASPTNCLSRKSENQDRPERWFLLVKRPEGGLLAGLQEFPTMADVETPSNAADDMVASALTATQLLLVPTITPSASIITEPTVQTKTKNKGKQVTRPTRSKGTLDAMWSRSNPGSNGAVDVTPGPVPSPSGTPVEEGQLQISRVTNVGSVQHIFSHIRKEYCVRWVVLEGGSGLPELRTGLGANSGAKSDTQGKSSGKGKKGGKVLNKRARENAPSSEEEDEANFSATARWVRLEEVRDANIGTGVVKIWDRVRVLWED